MAIAVLRTLFGMGALDLAMIIRSEPPKPPAVFVIRNKPDFRWNLLPPLSAFSGPRRPAGRRPRVTASASTLSLIQPRSLHLLPGVPARFRLGCLAALRLRLRPGGGLVRALLHTDW